MNDFLKMVRTLALNEHDINTRNIGGTNPLALAYAGDTIYDLYIRTYLIYRYDYPVHKLHVMATTFVKAKAQSDTVKKIFPMLTDEEQGIVKWGRNAKTATIPKHAEVIDYHNATGFETLIGYLYFTEKDERLMQVLGMTMYSDVDDES